MKMFLVFLALAAAFILPGHLSIFAPLLFGLPHVVSGAQHFASRDDLSEKFKYSLVAIALGMIAVVVMGLSLLLFFFGIAAVLGVVLEEGPMQKRIIVLAIASLLLLINLYWPYQLNQTLVMGHNVVALVMWALYSAQNKRDVLGVLLFAIIGSAIFLPMEDAWLKTFVFLQLLHYLVWIKWIPEEQRSSPKKWVWAATILGCFLAVGGYHAGNAEEWKRIYLLLFQFHVYLELIVLAHLFVNQRELILQKVSK